MMLIEKLGECRTDRINNYAGIRAAPSAGQWTGRRLIGRNPELKSQLSRQQRLPNESSQAAKFDSGWDCARANVG
jgi:hypothetical protein